MNISSVLASSGPDVGTERSRAPLGAGANHSAKIGGGKASAKSSDAAEAAHAQEEKLIRQFESVMMSMVLKQMRQTGTGEEGLFPGDSSDTLGGMFDMYLGEHLAESGGFGLMDAFRGRLLSGPQTLSPQEATDQIRQQATEAYRHVSTAAVQ